MESQLLGLKGFPKICFLFGGALKIQYILMVVQNASFSLTFKYINALFLYIKYTYFFSVIAVLAFFQ